MVKFQIFSDIFEATMYDFAEFIDGVKDGEDVLIEITSHGGMVFYGNAIFQKIQEAQARGVHFTARVYGLAASSAADIVLACDRIEMAQTAAIMVHSAWNPRGKADDGIDVANEAQLSVIRKRLPEYTDEDLSKDRWFKADEALKIGLIDAIFNASIDSEQARLCAQYLGDKAMEDEKKDVEKPAEKGEVVEEELEKKEEVKSDGEPSIEDLLERMAERFDSIEERLRKIEEASAECGGERRDNARLKAVFDKIAAVSKPCVSCDSVMVSKIEDPKAELEKSKEKYPNLDRMVGDD